MPSFASSAEPSQSIVVRPLAPPRTEPTELDGPTAWAAWFFFCATDKARRRRMDGQLSVTDVAGSGVGQCGGVERTRSATLARLSSIVLSTAENRACEQPRKMRRDGTEEGELLGRDSRVDGQARAKASGGRGS